jgi:PAS domain S-box-containing protein
MYKLKEEFKVVLIYLVLSLVWIYFSDMLLGAAVSDISQLSQLQTYKGIIYVLITSAVFYLLFKKYLNDLRRQKHKLEATNEKLLQYNKEIKAVNQELDYSFKSLDELNKRFVKMINSISSLNNKSNLDEEDFLSDLLDNIIEIAAEADYGKIYIIENGKCKFINTVGHDIELLNEIKFTEENLADFDSDGVNFSQDYSVKIEDLADEKKDISAAALKEIKESIYINIKVNDKVIGRISLDIAAESEKSFSKSTTNILESFSTLAASFFAFKRYDRLQDKFTKELISSIAKILELYDVYTKGHSENVANLSMLIAKEMNLSEKTVLDAYWSGMVHDIGKLLVPVQILNKTAKLEEFEYEIIKKHPVWSSEALSGSETLDHISEYVLYHHERWDGSGYPERLAAEDIPLVSQIIAVADAWDAMTSNRSYRNSLSQAEALKEIKENRGSQFSPRVVDAFLKVIEQQGLNIKQEVLDEFEALEGSELSLDNRDHFETLFKKAKEGMVILDENFKIKKTNKYFLEFFDYQESEVLGKKIGDVLVPAEKMDELEANIKKISHNNEVNLRTYRKRKDGQRIDVEIQAFPLAIGTKGVEYYLIYRDITELETVRNKYKNYKGRYESFFENDAIVMLIIDPESGKIIDANPAAVNFYGWSKKELTKMNISEINQLSKAEVKAEMQAARRKNKRFFNFVHQTSDGSNKEVEVYSQPIDFGDQDLLYSIIHEKRESKIKR